MWSSASLIPYKEQLELAREWERRLVIPVAKKIGIDMEAFRKKMYEKNSDGDWEEFGDKAVDYKWATSVVERIEETGLVKNPDAEGASMPKRMLEEKEDGKGQRYVSLPRLSLSHCDTLYFDHVLANKVFALGTAFSPRLDDNS